MLFFYNIKFISIFDFYFYVLLVSGHVLPSGVVFMKSIVQDTLIAVLLYSLAIRQ